MSEKYDVRLLLGVHHTNQHRTTKKKKIKENEEFHNAK